MLPRAATSPELARLRLNGQWAELLACIPTPATVYTAQVNGTPAGTDQLTQITYDGGSGTLGNVLPGMTIAIGTTPGASDIGLARIRKAPTSTIFYIGTESELSILDEHYLTVWDEFGLWQKRVKIDAGTIYMDEDIAYSNQHTSRLPVVVLGGPVVLELVGASVTAVFDASGSWVPGGGSATYLFVAPGASATSGLTTATPTMTYTAAGRYRVACTVTIGGVPNTRYEYVQVFDSANPPLVPVLKSLTCSKSGGGYSASLVFYDQVGQAAVRDRAQVILFERAHYGAGGLGSVGYAAGRENIAMIGWIDGETISWSPDLSSVTFQVEGAHAWLARINAYPQGLEDVTTTPALWTEYNTLTMTAFLWCVLTWRSTVAQAIDCIVEQSATRTIELSAAATSVWDQLVVNAGTRLLAQPCTDHLARLFVLIDSQFRADRSSVAEVMTLTKADYRPPIALARVIVPPVSMVDQSGFAWDGVNATALFSLSPGRVWKRHGRVQSAQALLFTDQGQANTICGLIAGQSNNEYPSVPIALAANNRMLDIAPDCYVKLSLAAGETPRGLSFTDRRFIPRSISWAYDAASGGLLPTVTFEAETFQQLAVTGDAPATEPVPPPPPPPVGCPTGYHKDLITGLCVADAAGGGIGDGNTVLVATNAMLAMTTNFLDPSPTYASLLGGTTLSSNLTAFCLYSYDPAHVAFVCLEDKVYMVTGLQTGTPVWTVILTAAEAGASYFSCVASPICDPNVLWVGWNNSSGRGGVSRIAIDVTIPGRTAYWNLAYESSSTSPANIARRIIADFVDGTICYEALTMGALFDGSAHRGLLSKITFTGSALTNARVAVFGNTPGGTGEGDSFLVDFDRALPDNGQTVWAVSESGGFYLKVSHDGGATFTHPAALPYNFVPGAEKWQDRIIINIATADSTDVVIGLSSKTASTNVDEIFRSTDNGATFSTILSASLLNSPGLVAIGRWPYNAGVVYFLANSIYYTGDMFATGLVDKIGNWVAAFGAWPQNQSIVEPINIIPVWLAY